MDDAHANWSARAHRAAGQENEVLLVHSEPRDGRTLFQVFGGFGWPLEWVRIAEFHRAEPDFKRSIDVERTIKILGTIALLAWYVDYNSDNDD